MGKYSTDGDLPVFDNKNFTAAKILEQNWGGIRKELEAILPHRKELPSLQDVQREQKVLNQDDNWKTYFLYGFGIKATGNCQACPFTTQVLESIEGMKTAFFSILSPGKHIPAHKGIYKGLIRMHLGLIIPGNTGDCKMRIDKQFIHWEEGKAVVFDDTYDHEVWNNSSEVRVVLLVDIMRPYRGFFARLNKAVVNLIGHSSYVKEAMRNHQKWEQGFHQNINKS